MNSSGSILMISERRQHRSQGLKAQILIVRAFAFREGLTVRIAPPISEEAADRYARIKRRIERRGSRLDENDVWIAATSLSLGAILVTADSDFQRVRGLTLEDWVEENSR